ncbi:hypothetical protein LEP1GSC062_0660 [Leptospira alexanderi serovar Manhao 3 str. L 60]|uniref:Uncharacterized protein n=1 Tax=Leptospira alexanderi serovar Manhao 3 str. L 60 TaxID=1049759 RepID=V6I2Z2_9LEPT|nr:hypothetical protein LEP1GSC062_0660 [Leptospira alexanderi serovar Manhao 3 str. L 60]
MVGPPRKEFFYGSFSALQIPIFGSVFSEDEKIFCFFDLCCSSLCFHLTSERIESGRPTRITSFS